MSLVLVGGIAGFITMLLAEVVKQSTWPKWLNAVAADLMQIIAVTVVALQHAGISGVTWSDFGRALLGAAVAFASGYLAVVKPIVGNKLQDATTFAPPPEPAPTKAIAKKAPARKRVR